MQLIHKQIANDMKIFLSLIFYKDLDLAGIVLFRATRWGLYIKAQTDIEVTSSPFLYSGVPILKQSRHDKRREEKSDGLIVP